jgi:hypothetical protein
MTNTACDLCKTPLPIDQLVTISGKTVCAKCKPEVVMNLKSGVGSGPRVTPELAEQIRKKISRLNILSFVLALPGLGLQIAGAMASGARTAGEELTAAQAGGALLQLLGVPLVIGGLACYGLMKGRSWALGLFGLLSCFGLLILHFFPKKCHNCRTGASYRAKDCVSCGAPV